MSIVFLNGQFIPENEARISPMDRGFLFGEGLYESIPTYSGKIIGAKLHLDRLNFGLDALQIPHPMSHAEWVELFNEILQRNEGDNLGIYVHVTRGVSQKRFHGYMSDTAPTVFIRTFSINAPLEAGAEPLQVAKVLSQEDRRWDHCNIKSTSLLGNVLHFQHSHQQGYDETLLFNEHNELTEASSANVFVVKGEVISTPVLDKQILPGITRDILIQVLQRFAGITVEERAISMDEVKNADEIWLTSSTREIMPVIELDDHPVGNGAIGNVWRKVQPLYATHKFDI
ncbi:aminotransferase class IV [Paraneptunicella aestuarii]|uniref:aminotransferase class IV n=1 Tax=Paraneptunicella aestuarii TaxID=2831148 RepID=UPI001E4CEA9E|nr:aminotransferase class IV [Paraneptunicella aestuarii]UAA37278.1 aminotransferase class IV [Paraneptunicella aestuarii]